MANNDSSSEDIYTGYASCPDIQHIYLNYSKNNQSIWIEKSQQTIQDYIDHLSSFKDFQAAYKFFAKKRHQIALDLQQKNEEGRTDLYGALRQEGDHFRKKIYSGDKETFWKWQKSKVFELCYKLTEPARNISDFNKKTGYIYEDEHIACIKELVSLDENQAIYYCVTIKYPAEMAALLNDGQQHSLSTIELFEFQEKKNLNMICIIYTPVDIQTRDKIYQLLNHFYQLLLKWNPQDGVDTFLTVAGKLAFMLAHYHLVKQGNVGITEWMLRAIAFSKGIKLGHFNHAEGISWDFKAVLTPNIDEYVKWFCTKAFLDYELISAEEISKGFKFYK